MKKLQEIVVLGAGESGTGAAILAKTKGLPVFLSDNKEIKENYKSVLTHFEIDFEENGHNLNRILQAGLVVKSPGIPDNLLLIKQIREKGIAVISEIEFAGKFTDAKMVCITGSNGKTTTTMFIHHILKTAGLNVGLAGNVGKSFAWQVATEKHDVYVLEISSFQLDGMYEFKADIAVLLNITPDHLDRYEYNFSKYADSKFRILQNQNENGALIYYADSPVIMQGLAERKVQAKKFPITLKNQITGDGAFLKNENIIINVNKKQLNMTLEQLALQGKHNAINSMAAGVAAKLMDIRNETIKQCMSDFHNVPHRLEHVSMVHGITFINDSKATNVNSTWYALESIGQPTVWIAGGIDKGNDYEDLKILVKQKVKAIVCLGVDNEKIHEEFSGIVKTIVDADSAEDAVRQAYYLANKGDAVLLSPACASFDLFENYEDRGNQFKKAVKDL